jgi:trypsin-like peptidase
MWHVIGIPLRTGKLYWKCFEDQWDNEEGIKVQIRFISKEPPLEHHTLKDIEGKIISNNIPWIVAGRSGWSIYADKLKESFSALNSQNWLKGKARLEPKIEAREKNVLNHKRYEGVVAWYLIPAIFRFNFEDIHQSLFVLEDVTNQSVQGTAFALAGVGLVTCHHVLTPHTKAWRAANPFNQYSIETIAANGDLDLAIIRLQAPPGKSSPLGTELEARIAPELEQWEEITVAGFPNYRVGDLAQIIPCLVVGSRIISSIRRLMVNAPIITGMSGGPAIDSDNNVVGVAVTGADRMETVSDTEKHGIIPIGALHYLLNKRE